jgi:hypothetical protein
MAVLRYGAPKSNSHTFYVVRVLPLWFVRSARQLYMFRELEADEAAVIASMPVLFFA